ncbi:protein kinase [bacterium]|nr:protein kinase [bacterium]
MQSVEIGQVLAKRYRIEARLGSGGMGTVYKATDLTDNRILALKVLDYRGTVDESESRFRREFRAISKCHHPHVVVVHDISSDGTILFIVMEYIKGPDLRGHLIRKLKNKGVQEFSLREFIEIFIQVCDGLDFIHSQKIIHRDIKPENILIESGPHAKIMDFGLSRVLDVSSYITKTGEIMGTAAYLSPEQGRGEKVGYWSDIYSLGVVMFEAVTGRLPFNGTNPIALVFQHIQEMPVSPKTYNPGIPDKLEQIIMKTLQKDPFERYQRASEIVDDLRYVVDEASSAGVIDEKTSVLELLSSLVKRPDFLFDPVFVGRREELNQINEMIIDVKNDRGATLLIEGDAGIGKTRLVEEASRFIKKFMKKGTILMVSGSCAEHETIPYKPLIECLRNLLVKSEVLSDQQTREHINDWGKELATLLPELGVFLKGGSERVVINDAQTEPNHEKIKQVLYQSVARFLRLICDRRPIIIFVDNLQWADSATLDMFRALMSETANMPLLLMSAYRPYDFIRTFFQFLSERKQVSGTYSARRLSIKPLKSKDIKKMVLSMLGSSTLTFESFIDRITTISEGNPYYIEEIMRSSLEEGTLRRHEGSWQIDQESVQSISMPSTIRELVMKRLQHLTPVLQHMLEYVAVLGRVNQISLLSTLMNMPEQDILNLIDDLIRQGILVENQPNQKEPEEYSFQHTLLRDILVKRIQRKSKMLIHERIANYFEETYRDSQDEHFEQLAYHYLQSRNKAKALKYVLLSADRADRIFANETALDYYRKALKLVRDEGETYRDYSEQRIMREIARILIRMGDHKTALEMVQEALPIAEDQADFKEVLQLFNIRAVIYYRLSDYVKALEYWEKALVISEKTGNTTIKAHILDDIGLVCLNLGQYIEAEEYINQSLNINMAGKCISGQAYNFHHLGTICESRGHFDDALRHFDTSLKIMKQLKNQVGVAESLNAIGSIHASRGHFLDAATFHEQAYGIAESLGIAHLTCSVLVNNGVDQLYIGQFCRAYEVLSKAHGIASEIEDTLLQIKATGYLSRFYLQIKRIEEAGDRADEAYDLVKKSGNRNLETWVLGIKAAVQLSRNNYDKAQQMAEASLELAESIGDTQNQLLAIHLLLMVHFELFRNEEAINLGNLALKRADETGNDFVRMVSLLYLSVLSLRQNDLDGAQGLLSRADALCQVISATDYQWRIAKAQARLCYIRADRTTAIEMLIQATRILDTLIKENVPDTFRKAYHNDRERLSLYGFLIALLIDSGRSEEAVQYLLIATSEELRSFLFNKNKNGWNGEMIAGMLSMERTGFAV